MNAARKMICPSCGRTLFACEARAAALLRRTAPAHFCHCGTPERAAPCDPCCSSCGGIVRA